MILKTAGHGGLVSPLAFDDVRRPMPRWMLAAIGASIAVHVAGGVWLYNQRFEMPVLDDPPTTVTTLIPYERPPVEVTPTQPTPTRPATVDVRTPSIAPPIDVPVIPIAPSETVDAKPGLPLVIATTPVASGAGEGGGEGSGVSAGPPVISDPQWLRLPSAEQLARAYPPRAINDDVTGQATIRCGVTVGGTLKGCVPTAESPRGYGFGPAAVRLSRHFRMKPATVDGKPVEGVVTIPVTFNLE